MRRIAERIGSAPTTIYWYVSNKSELYELMVDTVLGEIELPDGPSGGWRAGLSSLAWATLATMRRHRWFSQIGIQPVPGPSTLRYAAAALPILTEAGMGETTGIKVLATLNNYIFGFIQRELAWWQPLTPAEPPETPAADRVDVLEGRPGEAPMTDESTAARMRLAGDESFAFGLDRFLDGIAVLVDSLHRPGDHVPAGPSTKGRVQRS